MRTAGGQPVSERAGWPPPPIREPRRRRDVDRVGWRLAEEIAWARPERPGPEWWTLLDIAQDANDETRQGWPGRDYLAARAKKSPRTIDRYVEALVKAGKLRIVRPAAPGRRPVYEVPILFELSTTCDTVDGARTVPSEPVDNSSSCDTIDVARSNGSYPQRATFGGLTCDTVDGAPPVITTRQNTGVTVTDSSVEGSGLDVAEPPAGSRQPTRLELAALTAVAESRKHRSAV